MTRLEYEREYRRTHRAEANRRTRQCKLRKLGLTEESYSQMLGEQLNACKACGRQMAMTVGVSNSCCIDHDHATGQVRGLLCNACNLILGHAGDQPERLHSLIAYLG